MGAMGGGLSTILFKMMEEHKVLIPFKVQCS